MLMCVATRKANGKFNDGWTREHVVPLSKGGRRAYMNVVLAHKNCNEKRGNSDPTPTMLEKHKSIWLRANEYSHKQAKKLISDKTLRGTYCAVLDFNYVMFDEFQPKFIP